MQQLSFISQLKRLNKHNKNNQDNQDNEDKDKPVISHPLIITEIPFVELIFVQMEEESSLLMFYKN